MIQKGKKVIEIRLGPKGETTSIIHIQPLIERAGSDPAGLGVILADALQVAADAYHDVLVDPRTGEHIPHEVALQRIVDTLVAEVDRPSAAVAIRTVPGTGKPFDNPSTAALKRKLKGGGD